MPLVGHTFLQAQSDGYIFSIRVPSSQGLRHCTKLTQKPTSTVTKRSRTIWQMLMLKLHYLVNVLLLNKFSHCAKTQMYPPMWLTQCVHEPGRNCKQSSSHLLLQTSSFQVLDISLSQMVPEESPVPQANSEFV